MMMLSWGRWRSNAELLTTHGASGWGLQQRASEIVRAEAFLLHLNARTWTSAETDRLALDVQAALDSRVKLLLAHEMPGDDASVRRPIEFQSFFEDTPAELVQGGVYRSIAAPLKGGALRQVRRRRT